MKRREVMVLEVEVDEMQTEKIRIFSTDEVKKKLGQFFKAYSINDPLFKKRIIDRIGNFMEQLQEKKLYSNNLNLESSKSLVASTPSQRRKFKINYKANLSSTNRIKSL